MYLHVGAKGLSQNVTIAADNTPLEKVFTAVEQQTGYVFFFNKAVLKNTRPVTIKAENMPLETFLNRYMDKPVAEFSFQNKTIVILRKLYQSKLNPHRLRSFLHHMTFTVASSTKKSEPVAGVSSKLKGHNGDTTDVNSIFHCQV